jgi:hypothetical protein
LTPHVILSIYLFIYLFFFAKSSTADTHTGTTAAAHRPLVFELELDDIGAPDFCTWSAGVKHSWGTRALRRIRVLPTGDGEEDGLMQ